MGRAGKALRVFGWIAAGLYLVVGVGELLFAGDPLEHRALFCAVLTLFAVLVVGGIRLIESRGWIGVPVASAGAVLAGFALFWTGLAVLLAIAIVVLGIVCAHGGPGPVEQPAEA